MGQNNIHKKQVFKNKHDYYTTHLLVVNVWLPVKLSAKEIEVLAAFMSLSGDLVQEDRLCTSARKDVRERLNLSYGGLGNYIAAFEKKGVIKYDSKRKAYIPSVLFPSSNYQRYTFEIALEE